MSESTTHTLTPSSAPGAPPAPAHVTGEATGVVTGAAPRVATRAVSRTSNAPSARALVNEEQVRAAAGITLAAGSVAFAYAYFRHTYWPLQGVSSLFAAEFVTRTVAGIDHSPVGALAKALTRRQPPQWVSAGPKRFAWRLGLVMATAMAVITNAGVRGPLPRTICLICLALMWLESALGLCLGCELHRLLSRRGLFQAGARDQVCTHGACETAPNHATPLTPTRHPPDESGRGRKATTPGARHRR